MASYNRLIDNYERRIKELNSDLVAFNLQAGHLLLSGKTDFSDNEYNRPYELIAAEISSINDQCREITANERRKSELEKASVDLKKKIQSYGPDKKKRYSELGAYIFETYTQHFAASFGSVYQLVSEEKKATHIIAGKLADIEEQLENKDFFSKLVFYVRQSSLKAQLSSRERKIEDLLAEGGEKAFKAGSVTAENGGTAYSSCRILQEEIDSLSSKLDDMTAELAKISDKLKETDKKSELLAAAADKAGELDKLAERAGAKFIGNYVSSDGKITGTFPESYGSILKNAVETKLELASIARRKEMLLCSERIESAASSIAALSKEKDLVLADIERLTKRSEELAERIEATAAAADVIKQRKIALEVEEGVSVSRLLGVNEESISSAEKRESDQAEVVQEHVEDVPQQAAPEKKGPQPVEAETAAEASSLVQEPELVTASPEETPKEAKAPKDAKEKKTSKTPKKSSKTAESSSGEKKETSPGVTKTKKSSSKSGKPKTTATKTKSEKTKSEKTKAAAEAQPEEKAE
ncbi:MAG: hypothetical protein K5930_03250 [Treponemataceae bacterium]|nr:hypothetical protein [Treponemataceae bacterium]